MTKAELVALITHQTGVEKTAAEAVVEAFMRNIKETLGSFGWTSATILLFLGRI